MKLRNIRLTNIKLLNIRFNHIKWKLSWVPVLAAVILLNIGVGRIPSAYTKFDVSEQKLFTVGEQTEQIVSGLTQDVYLYFLAQEGGEDTTLLELLERYKALSDHIRVEQKDPVQYPDFIRQYTDSQLSDNSILVVCGDYSRAIDFYDMYEYGFDYSDYSSSLTAFDGEGQITSAIAYVTSAEIPILYTLEGHQEAELSDSMRTAVEKENVEVRTLNLLTSEAVPKDAEVLMIYAPLVDISRDEKEKILDYMRLGGRLLWIAGYTEAECPNLDELLEEYGLELAQGVVVEDDRDYYIPNYPQYLLPDVRNTEMTANVAGRYILAPFAKGLVQAQDMRDTLNITELLATSDAAFSKVDVSAGTLAREEGDIQGPFMLGAAVTEEVTGGRDGSLDGDEDVSAGGSAGGEDSPEETRLIVFSSEYMLDEQMDAMVSGGNTQLVMGAVSWLSGHKTTISIESKSLQTEYLTVPAGAAVFWGFLVTLILPVCLLVGGGMICYSRRKR